MFKMQQIFLRVIVRVQYLRDVHRTTVVCQLSEESCFQFFFAAHVWNIKFTVLLSTNGVDYKKITGQNNCHQVVE